MDTTASLEAMEDQMAEDIEWQGIFIGENIKEVLRQFNRNGNLLEFMSSLSNFDMSSLSNFSTLSNFDFSPLRPIPFNLLMVAVAYLMDRLITRFFEKSNPSFRIRNGHNIADLSLWFFLFWCAALACGGISFLPGIFVPELPVQVFTIGCSLIIIVAIGVLFSSVYIASYASVILAHRAESEPYVAGSSSSFYTFVRPKSFYSFIREGIYLGILVYALTSNISTLILTLFASIFVTAVYDVVGIPSLGCSASIPSLGRNINFPYKGLLFCAIGSFLYYLYHHQDLYDENIIVFLFCVLSSTFLLLINLVRIALYNDGAKNDLKEGDDFIVKTLRR